MCEPNEPLKVNILFQHTQKMLTSDTAVIAETWDSRFNCQKLKLPEGCGYEFQMQYGSIGWSVGATLVYAQAVPEKRVLAFIGDGSFQGCCRVSKFESIDSLKYLEEIIRAFNGAVFVRGDVGSQIPLESKFHLRSTESMLLQ